MRFVGLLRGVNVGGNNRVPMADLRGWFADAGAADVSTYIASGNVVFEASPGAVPGIGAAVEAALAASGVHTWLVFRSSEQVEALIARNPFPDVADGKHLHVSFLVGEPARERVAGLDPSRSPRDQVRVLGQELWLHTPDGLAATKFDPTWLDRALGTRGTMRNWKTVQALRDLL